MKLFHKTKGIHHTKNPHLLKQNHVMKSVQTPHPPHLRGRWCGFGPNLSWASSPDPPPGPELKAYQTTPSSIIQSTNLQGIGLFSPIPQRSTWIGVMDCSVVWLPLTWARSPKEVVRPVSACGLDRSSAAGIGAG